MLQVARIVDRTEVLGPGVRAVVLVQGCNLRCRGCIAQETHALDGGERIGVEALTARLLTLPIDGVTCSGGEPFLQAAALTRLVDGLREARPELSLMAYSGYRLEWLREHGSRAQNELLGRLDLLVDGPFVELWHRPLRWRGSANQRLIALTSRHAGELAPDVSAGVEMTLTPALELSWVGVPPVPGFATALEEATGVEQESDERGAAR